METERQEQSDPALYEVKVTAPPRRFPVWATVVGVPLGVNLIVLIAVLQPRDSQKPAVLATVDQIAAHVRTAGGAATGASILRRALAPTRTSK